MKKSLFLFAVIFFVFPVSALASTNIYLSNLNLNEKTTITAQITGQNCTKDASGNPTSQSFTVSGIVITAADANVGGFEVLDLSQASVTVSKNGEFIAGTFNPPRNWTPESSFSYTGSDALTVTMSNALILKSTKAYISFQVQQPNYNQCITGKEGGTYVQIGLTPPSPTLNSPSPTMINKPSPSAAVKKTINPFYNTNKNTKESFLFKIYKSLLSFFKFHK